MSAPELEPAPGKPLTVWLCVAVILGGFFVGIKYIQEKVLPDIQASADHPPKIRRLEKDLEATERSGKTVRLGELKGKVFLLSYVYTSCPRGCGGVIAQLRDVHKTFGSNPKFHMITASVYASHEPPELLQTFAKAHEVDFPNWWFLTGDESAIRTFMQKSVGLEPVNDVPVAERISPTDLFEHDLRVVLVDAQGHVRGYHQVGNPDPGIQKMVMEKLNKDLATVLAEKD
jgi:protein SCO1